MANRPASSAPPPSPPSLAIHRQRADEALRCGAKLQRPADLSWGALSISSSADLIASADGLQVANHTMRRYERRRRRGAGHAV